MRECKWLNVSQLTEYYTLLQFWKTVNWDIPVHMSEQIEVNDDRSVSTKQPRLILTANSYRVKATVFWNALPDFLKNEKCISKFKKGPKKWIFERIKPDPGLMQP